MTRKATVSSPCFASPAILKRLIHAPIEPIVDPLLPSKQAGFRRGRSTVDQTVLLTQNIEDSFEAKKKAGAVFVDLTAPYDTVWYSDLTCKLLRLLPNKHMVRMIMKLVWNRSFTLTIGDSKQTRLRRLQNGLPQESVLAHLLFNIYTYDLPSMNSQKYAYADDLALLYASRDWKAVEDTLSQDMTALSAYLQTWRLKLSNTKTVTADFHLNNKEAKRELNVYNNGNLLPPCPIPTYLGVKPDAHFPSPPRGFVQKTLHPNRADEATCGIRMRCRCKDIAHLFCFLGLLHS